MPATNDRRPALPTATATATAAGALALLGCVAPLEAHPMPDTEITVSRGAEALNVVVRLPMSDLLLALPPHLPRDADVLLSGDQSDLRAYVAAHTHLLTPSGKAQIAIGPISLTHERNPHVGDYEQLEVTASVPVGAGVPLSLGYDGVLHRIANHRAVVRDGAGQPIGVIRYNLATKTAAPLSLPAAPVP